MNNNIQENNLLNNENINNLNNSNNNIIKVPKSNKSSEELIFFKEEILKDMKKLDSKLSIKYDVQYTTNSNKIKIIEGAIEQINQKIDYLSSAIISENLIKEKVDKLSSWITKIDESLILQDVRLKNIGTKLTESIDRFDNLFLETVIYPGIIGPKAKYKSFHELIDFIIYNLNQLLLFKEKNTVDVKDYKYKIDSLISNFQVKLDYLTKNTKEFTSSSLRNIEKKIEQTLKTQLDDFRAQFSFFKSFQEANLLKINENSKKLEEIVKNFEKLKENENKKPKRKYRSTVENINLSGIKSNKYFFQKAQRRKTNINFDLNINRATSVVKDYIKGRINENEVDNKRRSVSFMENKEKEMINLKRTIPIKVYRRKDNSTEKISLNISSISSQNEEEDEKKKEKEKENIKDKETNKEEVNNKMENIEYKIEDEKNEINSEFKKKLIGVNGNDNNLIKRQDKNANINSSILKKKSNNISEIEKQNKNKTINNVYFNMSYNNSYSNINNKNIKTIDLSKSNNFNNNNNSLLNKKNKFENVQDIKDLINIIKKDTRENMIPIIPLNKLNVKTNTTINNTIQSNINSINKNFIIENNYNNNIIQDYPYIKNEYSKIKLKTPMSNNSQKFIINDSILSKTFYDNKRMNKNYSAEDLKYKNKKNKINKIEVNFNPFLGNNIEKEKDEKKMEKIFNQMKDFLPSDEKLLIKDRFIKYGFNKEKIFSNNKKKIKFDEDINIFPNTNKANNNFQFKSIDYEGK